MIGSPPSWDIYMYVDLPVWYCILFFQSARESLFGASGVVRCGWGGGDKGRGLKR